MHYHPPTDPQNVACRHAYELRKRDRRWNPAADRYVEARARRTYARQIVLLVLALGLLLFSAWGCTWRPWRASSWVSFPSSCYENGVNLCEETDTYRLEVLP